jgi:iron complex transport system ATP-binding protein
MAQATQIGLSCQQLSVSVPGRTLVRDLNLLAAQGQFIAILGQNGAGKSLTMHTLASLRPPDSGDVLLDGDNLTQWNRIAVARRLALLPQYTEDIFPATALDTVMIGRHPHIGRFSWESEQDRDIAREALVNMDLGEMLQRDVLTLSGGERRRLAIAQILAQTPEIFLLDEPTNHLDPQHQLQVLQMFRERANDGAAVVASLHDVNLAARFADHCLLLFGDGRWKLGQTQQVLTEQRLSELYATPMEAVQWRDRELFVATSA